MVSDPVVVFVDEIRGEDLELKVEYLSSAEVNEFLRWDKYVKISFLVIRLFFPLPLINFNSSWSSPSAFTILFTKGERNSLLIFWDSDDTMVLALSKLLEIVSNSGSGSGREKVFA